MPTTDGPQTSPVPTSSDREREKRLQSLPKCQCFWQRRTGMRTGASWLIGETSGALWKSIGQTDMDQERPVWWWGWCVCVCVRVRVRFRSESGTVYVTVAFQICTNKRERERERERERVYWIGECHYIPMIYRATAERSLPPTWVNNLERVCRSAHVSVWLTWLVLLDREIELFAVKMW